MKATAKQASMIEHSHPPPGACEIWCGQEGWLSLGEVVRRTEQDIAGYARRQPLKFRQAMIGVHALKYDWGSMMHYLNRKERP